MRQFDDAEEEDSERSLGKKRKFKRRTIKRAKLFDVSAVTTPAYNVGTSVSARSANYVLRTAPRTSTLAAQDAAARAQLNRMATEINLAAPGLRVPAGTDRVVPMSLDECADPTSWGRDEIFICDVDVRARLRGAIAGSRIARDFQRESDRKLIEELRRQYGE